MRPYYIRKILFVKSVVFFEIHKQQVELLTNTIKDMIPKMGSNNNN
jgi:hypothetical protein